MGVSTSTHNSHPIIQSSFDSKIGYIPLFIVDMLLCRYLENVSEAVLIIKLRTLFVTKIYNAPMHSLDSPVPLACMFLD